MTIIHTVVHDRRIEMQAPTDLPDGTEVTLTIEADIHRRAETMAPEEIARVLAATEKLEPFDWSEEERAAADAWEKKINNYTIEKMKFEAEDAGNVWKAAHIWDVV